MVNFYQRMSKIAALPMANAWVWTKPGPGPVAMGYPMGYPMGHPMGHPMGYLILMIL